MDKRAALAMIASLFASAAAQAEVSINNHQTKNMVCSDGVCSPTAKGAYLNVKDLENLLKSSDVKVTTGAGAVTLGVDVPLTWTSNHRLTLDAIYRVAIKAPVTVAGKGALSIVYNDGGTDGDLLFFNGAKIDFWDLGSKVTVNGQSYELLADLPTLIQRIGNNASGAYALARDYDASQDGVYTDSPITAEFEGNFEGFGHRISNLSVKHSGRSLDTGFFYRIGENATVRDFGIADSSIDGGRRRNEAVGGLTGINRGTIAGVFTSGIVKSSALRAVVGGLAGINSGTVLHSHSDSAVSCGAELSDCGGLVGWAGGLVQQSFATGPVHCADRCFAGGLVGEEGDYILHQNKGVVVQSYATGAVTGSGGGSDVGGFAGLASDYTASETYATGAVGSGTYVGGWVGDDYHNGKRGNRTADYWDLDTSGIGDPSQGAGNVKNDKGVTGLTDAELKGALPDGFDPDVWRQSPDINNGYPYLIANPPPK
jgi:hypothetical protein